MSEESDRLREKLEEKYEVKPIEEKVKIEPSLVVPKEITRYDVSKVSDLKYLEDIFSSDYDKFKSLSYLQKTRDELISQGYPQTPALNEFLFWTTLSRRMQIIYQLSHKNLMATVKDGESLIPSENTDFLSEIMEVAEHVTVLQKAIDLSLQTSSQVRDVVDLHKETCEKAAKFLKAHWGEYVKADPRAKEIKDVTDKAYWAFVQDSVSREDGMENITYVWSEELKYLFEKKLIPLEYFAFVLRTSIEGLYYVARMRDDKISEVNRESVEHKLRDLMLDFEQERHEKDMLILEPSKETIKVEEIEKVDEEI